MLSIINHQENANQNCKKISPHTYQNVCHKIEVTSVGEVVEKRDPLCPTGRNVNWYSYCENNIEVPQKSKTRTIM